MKLFATTGETNKGESSPEMQFWIWHIVLGSELDH